MESVGQTLREARLRDGLTVQDVNARTRISVNNLLSIEADELHGISSRFLYKSFVRQVGQALKVDSAVFDCGRGDTGTAGSRAAGCACAAQTAKFAPATHSGIALGLLRQLAACDAGGLFDPLRDVAEQTIQRDSV